MLSFNTDLLILAFKISTNFKFAKLAQRTLGNTYRPDRFLKHNLGHVFFASIAQVQSHYSLYSF